MDVIPEPRRNFDFIGRVEHLVEDLGTLFQWLNSTRSNYNLPVVRNVVCNQGGSRQQVEGQCNWNSTTGANWSNGKTAQADVFSFFDPASQVPWNIQLNSKTQKHGELNKTDRSCGSSMLEYTPGWTPGLCQLLRADFICFGYDLPTECADPAALSEKKSLIRA